MERSRSHTLLLDNQLYLKAVQHKRITLENLGLHELEYSFSSTRNATGKPVLKAVIPSNNQVEFLQKIGLVESPVRPSSAKVKTTTEKPRVRPKRNHSEEHGHRHNKKHTKNKSEQTRPKSADPLSGTHLVRRTSVGGTPVYTKPSQTHLNLLEREKEEAIARNKAKEHAAKLGVNFELVDKDGTKYVYDQRGVKVTEEEYQKQLEEADRAKKRRSEDRIIPPHKTALIEKTRRFVEDLRKRIESQTILDFRWYPGKFPATTIPPRPHSADGRHGNSMRDISTLGKTLSTPFRKGEPHVLPANLVRQWPEYRVMEQGDVVLTVEHCCQCHEHDMCTHHKEEQYVQMAETVKENLAATAKKFAVRFYSVCKPVEFEDPMAKSLSHSERIVSGHSSHKPSKSTENAAFNIDYTQRMGAFEVQVAVRTKKDFICHLLFSKLFKGNWPRISTLQTLLERVLTEAKFVRLIHDVPKSPSRPNSRPGSPKRVPLYTPKEEKVIAELHPEFDNRLPVQDSEDEEELEEDEEKMSMPPGLSREPSTRLLSIPEHSDIEPEQNPPISASRRSSKGEAYSPEERAAASALTRFMRGKPAAQVDTAPSSKRSSFSSEYSEDESSASSPTAASPVRSTKAKLLALGSASAGLQFVRNKSKNKDHVEGAGLLSHEAALAIANGDTDVDKAPKSHITKKQSAIGILSRQNAGAGGNGRYLVVDDGDESPLQQHVQEETRPFFPSPIHIQKTNSQTSIPFVQPSPRNDQALSPKRASPHKKSSFSSVYEDEELVGFSPTSSHKSVSGFKSAARVAEVTQAGLSFVRNRSSSVTSMPQTPTMVEMLHERQSTGKLSQSERIQGRPNHRSPHNTHPSLEMRSKLNIGTLSRQNAGIRGESLLVADSESDDESRPGDKPASVPPQRILDAMASAVSAVSLAETLTNTAGSHSAASSSVNATTVTGASAAASQAPATTTTTTTASTLADRKPSNATTLDTGNTTERHDTFPLAPLMHPSQQHGHSGSSTALTTPMSSVTYTSYDVRTESNRDTPVAAISTARPSAPTQAAATPAPETVSATAAAPVIAAATAPVEKSTPAPSQPQPTTDNTTAPGPASIPAPEPDVAPAPIVLPTPVISAFAVRDDPTMGRRMSSAEVLQQKRGLADQLVLTVSRDILEPVPSEYADDFDDFENFSPSAKKAGNGFEDLFEASDFKLDDEI